MVRAIETCNYFYLTVNLANLTFAYIPSECFSSSKLNANCGASRSMGAWKGLNVSMTTNKGINRGQGDFSDRRKLKTFHPTVHCIGLYRISWFFFKRYGNMLTSDIKQMYIVELFERRVKTIRRYLVIKLTSLCRTLWQVPPWGNCTGWKGVKHLPTKLNSDKYNWK